MMKNRWKNTPKTQRNKVMKKISYALIGIEAALIIGTIYGFLTANLTMTLGYLILVTITYPLAIAALAGLYLKKKKEELTQNPMQGLGNMMSGMMEDDEEEENDEEGDLF